MKTEKLIRHGWQRFIFGAAVLLMTSVGFAETNSVRLAIGPFYAPTDNLKLEQAAAALPDLLTVSLSQDSRFQLVEREKVRAIWSELHLAEAGLTSVDTVGKLGKILSCDWLVSGSLVQAETGPQIWVKVIDTQNSIVLDLQALPYDTTNFPATAADIAHFLAQARSRTQPREFIALEHFRNMSVSSAREDWTPRLSALVEKHFLAAGYGVVERDTVAPIFSEYQLQSAGMTGDTNKRVKLKPAFWVVGGSWKWFRDTEDKLSVTISIRKMGGGEQLFSFTRPPGAELERTIIETIQSALKSSGSLTIEQAQAGEEQLRAGHAEELVRGRGGIRTPSRYDTNAPITSITVTDRYGGKRTLTVDPVMQAQMESHRQEMLKTLQQAILLNPKDMPSKFKLGMALFGATDAVEKKQGQDLLEEVAASGDAQYATKAKNWLEDFRTGKLSFQRDQIGNLQVIPHGEPASVPKASALSPERIAQLRAQAAKHMEITNVAARSEHFVQISAPPAVAYFDGGFNAFTILGKKLLVAGGKTVKYLDLTRGFGPGSGNDFENFELPVKIENPITVMEADANDLWIGTEGGGLIRLPQTGGAPRIFGEKDGFPMSSIKSLRVMPGRLLIGFGYRGSGAFGYLDTATGKFTGMMSQATVFKSREEALRPPPHSAVLQIKAEDDNNHIWVASEWALYRLKLDSQEWSLAWPESHPPGLRTLSVAGGFAATIVPSRCVAVSQQPWAQWTCVNISTNLNENYADTLVLDNAGAGLYLWIGSRGKITVLDMKTSKIIGECKMARPGTIELILCSPGSILFIGDDHISESYCLYYLNRPKF